MEPLLLHSLKRARLPNDNGDDDDDNDDDDDDDDDEDDDDYDDLFLSDASYVRANIVISLFLRDSLSFSLSPIPLAFVLSSLSFSLSVSFSRPLVLPDGGFPGLTRVADKESPRTL